MPEPAQPSAARSWAPIQTPQTQVAFAFVSHGALPSRGLRTVGSRRGPRGPPSLPCQPVASGPYTDAGQIRWPSHNDARVAATAGLSGRSLRLPAPRTSPSAALPWPSSEPRGPASRRVGSGQLLGRGGSAGPRGAHCPVGNADGRSESSVVRAEIREGTRNARREETRPRPAPQAGACPRILSCPGSRGSARGTLKRGAVRQAPSGATSRVESALGSGSAQRRGIRGPRSP